MRLSADGQDYIVHLNYSHGMFGGEPLTSVKAAVHEGLCIREPEDKACTKIATVGYAFCHPKDQFVKATGRKLALGRALRGLIADKTMRARLWADYRTKAS